MPLHSWLKFNPSFLLTFAIIFAATLQSALFGNSVTLTGVIIPDFGVAELGDELVKVK